MTPSKTTLYKTGSDKQTISTSPGISGWLNLAQAITYSTDNKNKLVSAFTNSPTQQLLTDLKTWTVVNGFITDGTNWTLPESLLSLQEVKAQMEMEKLGAAVKLVDLKKAIEDKQDEINTKQTEIKTKETAIDTLITEILTKKRQQLTTYNITKGFAKTATEDNRREEMELFNIQHLLLEIRYLENNGDATSISTIDAENTALTEIDNILNKTAGVDLDSFLVRAFSVIAAKLGEGKGYDTQKAIQAIKNGKYTHNNKEENVAIYGGLERFKEHFENREKLVKLSEWETEALSAIKKELGEIPNQKETLKTYTDLLKTFDASLESSFTEDLKTKWQSEEANKFKTSTNLKSLLESVKKDDKYEDFFNHVKGGGKGYDDLKDKETWGKLLLEEPKKVITAIERYKYDTMDDTGDDKTKKKTQIERKIKKHLNKKGTDSLTDAEINTVLYEVAISKITLSTKALKADLSEYGTTGGPTGDGEEKTGILAWLNNNYWWPVWVPVVGIGILTAIFWKQISSWWRGSAEEEGEITTNTTEESEEDAEEIK